MKGKLAKLMILIMVAVVFFWMLPSTLDARGAGIEWEILYQEAEKLYRAGNYSRGIIVAQKALELAEKNVGPNHSNVTKSLNILAILYVAIGEYAKAEPLYMRSLAIREKKLGPEHPKVATTLRNLAKLYRDMNRISEAEVLEKRATKIETIKR